MLHEPLILGVEFLLVLAFFFFFGNTFPVPTTDADSTLTLADATGFACRACYSDKVSLLKILKYYFKSELQLPYWCKLTEIISSIKPSLYASKLEVHYDR